MGGKTPISGSSPRSARGSVTISAVVGLDGSSARVPPREVTILREMPSPRPVPASLPLVVKNGVNMR
jgi:hypothetical protein